MRNAHAAAISLAMLITAEVIVYGALWNAVTSVDAPKEHLAMAANAVLRPEVQLQASQIECHFAEGSVFKLSGAFECHMPTTCGPSLMRPVYTDITGTSIRPDSIEYSFGRFCSEMLSEEGLAKADAQIDQGG